MIDPWLWLAAVYKVAQIVQVVFSKIPKAWSEYHRHYRFTLSNFDQGSSVATKDINAVGRDRMVTNAVPM